MFEIKYEIFEDDVDELRELDILTFDKEYNQIYGLFTLNVDGHNFIPYPPDNIPLSAKRIYSELILTHFKLLNDVVTLLDHHNYIALKYIENNSSWLELKIKNDLIKVTKRDCEIGSSLNSLICIEDKFLRGAMYGSFHDIPIIKEQFTNEINNKTKMFIEEIKSINPNILKSIFFKSLLERQG
ncbi:MULTISPECIES: hypothetical protein [unclassified Lysinibacillus]|uniref:hypothetical protein n=1 Tax=unclassified Lysinibacillus TaxID=2636778 RepID=UPI00381F9E63